MIAAEKIVVVDVDGTLADRCGPGQSYADVGAVPSVVQKIRWPEESRLLDHFVYEQKYAHV
jgi:hypothetical protein